MELEEKCKWIEELIQKGLHDKNVAKAEVSRADPWHGIWLTLNDQQFKGNKTKYPWDSILIANFFEQIYAKTRMIWTALDRHIGGVTVYLHDSDNLSSCDKDGTVWEDTGYKAQCPACGDKEKLAYLTYNPRDLRSLSCPTCKASNHLYSYWRSARYPNKEIHMPICEFGKKLDVNKIIEKVEYIKGDKNDVGDAPDDYVRITLKNECECHCHKEFDKVIACVDCGEHA